jgi:hypothetical protein
VELNADIVILKTNFHNETKILVEQVVEVNNSVSDIQKKIKVLENYKVNNNSTVTDTKRYQEEKVIKFDPCKTGSKNININSSFGKNINKVTFQKHCNSKHASIYKGSEEYDHECPPCSDRFTTIEAFNEHKADHLKEIESMDIRSLTNGHDIFECNLCSFESGNDDSVKEHMIEHVNAAPKKAEETVKQSNDDNMGSFESGYGDSLKEDAIHHVMPLSQTEKDKDKEITAKTMSQLLLEEFDSNYIGSDSDTGESEGEKD